MSVISQAQSLVDAALRDYNSGIVTETQKIVRTRRYQSFDLLTLLAELRAAGVTGTLMLDLHNGCPASARVVEECRIEPR